MCYHGWTLGLACVLPWLNAWVSLCVTMVECWHCYQSLEMMILFCHICYSVLFFIDLNFLALISFNHLNQTFLWYTLFKKYRFLWSAGFVYSQKCEEYVSHLLFRDKEMFCFGITWQLYLAYILKCNTRLF